MQTSRYLLLFLSYVMCGPSTETLVTLEDLEQQRVPIDIRTMKWVEGISIFIAYDDDPDHRGAVLPTLGAEFRSVHISLEILDVATGRRVAEIPMNVDQSEHEHRSRLEVDAAFGDRCVVSISIIGAGRSHKFKIPLEQFKLSGKLRLKGAEDKGKE